MSSLGSVGLALSGAISSVVVLAVGCPSPKTSTDEPSTTAVASDPAPAVSASNATSAIATVSSPPSSSASAVPAATGGCTKDTDCGWDDPCFPKRCVSPPVVAACDESGPRPGACFCIEGACTLKPKTPPQPSGSCEVRGCDVDVSRAVCVADTHGVPEGIRGQRGVDFGPSCDCIDPKRGCTFSWFEAVACKTDNDCWVADEPRRHPVANPSRRPFRPCKDGEVAPACKAGRCALGAAFKC